MRGTKRQAVLNHLLLEVGDGRHLSSSLTVGELLDQWWPAKRPKLSPTTARDWESCLRLHVRPNVSDLRLHRFRAMDMDRLYRRLGEAGLSPARIRRAHTILSTALAQAVSWEMIASNPAQSASPPEVREREIRPPAPEDVAAFATALEEDDPELAMFVWLASFTGARRGELCALRWTDIDLADGSILIARALVDVDLIRRRRADGVGTPRSPTVVHDHRPLRCVRPSRRPGGGRGLRVRVRCPDRS